MNEVNDLRLAFNHRYEWVASKVHTVNYARRAAVHKHLNEDDEDEDSDDESATSDVPRFDYFGKNEEPLSEEEDFEHAEVCICSHSISAYTNHCAAGSGRWCS
jgi:hypothetical protein